MKKNKTGALITLFIAAFIFNLLIKNAFAVFVGSKAMQDLEASQTQPQEEPLEVVERPNVEYKAENLRDPFQSVFKEGEAAQRQQAATTGVTLPGLTVQGIVWGGSITQAIINNKVIKVGDEIEGAKVIKIDKDGVWVLFGGSQYNLSSPIQMNIQNLKKEPEGGKDEGQIQF